MDITLDMDASNIGMGTVLSQQGENRERAVAFFSQALSEQNYRVMWQELLAVVAVLYHFQPYLYRKSFRLRTDHASLTWLLNLKKLEGQVASWLDQL